MVQGIETLQPPVSGRNKPQIAEEAVQKIGQAFNNLSEEELQSLRELSDELQDMSQEELTALKQVIDFINRRQDQYDAAVQAVIRQGLVEPGDLPPDYDPIFFSVLSNMVNDALQGNRPQKMAKGGIASLNKKAKKLSASGRYGDTMLAHLSPDSAKILKEAGGSGTINPKTGLREYSFFSSIGNFFKKAAGIILPVALNFAFPGLGTIASGAIGAGLGAMINGASPSQALTAGLVGGVGGALYSGATSMLGGGSFMQGVSNALPSGMQAMFSTPTTGAAAATPTVSPNLSGFGGGSTSPAGAPGIMQKATSWMSEHPYLTAGGAALLGGALVSGMSEEDKGKPIQRKDVEPVRFAPGTFALYQAPRVNVVPTYSPAYAAQGGEIDARRGGHLSGPGTGTSDSIPAKLSDGEFVMTAKAVRGAGEGDRMKGAKRMYDMMHKFEKRA